MDEFLEKLAEDQRRMRKFLRTQGPRFKKIGDAFAVARERGSRIFVVGEPPLDQLAPILAMEYLQQLPALALSLEDKGAPPAPDESGELEPHGSSGPPLIARHLSRHFRAHDVLLVLAHNGQSSAVKALLGFAKLKAVFTILVGGLDAREQLRRAADTAITLPTKGVKTVCEASFVVARIMARVARARFKERTGEDDERLVKLECASCRETVFVDEKQKGKKGQCPLCRSPLEVTSERFAVAEASGSTTPRSDIQPIKTSKSPGSSRRKKKPLKQSVLNVPAVAGEAALEALEELSGRGEKAPPISEKALREAAGETTSSDGEAPVGLSSAGDSDDVDETVIAPEDVAFDEFANVTESADPFALPDAFVADLVMPQLRPAAGPVAPSDANPVTGSGEREGVAAALTASSSESARNSRLVSARFTVQDCKVRFGRGGYPDDTGPEHPLDQLSTAGAVFSLDPQDELGSTVEKGDELWVRIAVPAFIEPVLVRGTVLKIGGNSDGGRAGTRLELEWKELNPDVTRKLARAAETLGAPTS